MRYKAWNYVGATYDGNTGMATLWVNNRPVVRSNIGRIRLATNRPVRMGAKIGDRRYFRGRVSCVQVYSVALNRKQIIHASKRCFKRKFCLKAACFIILHVAELDAVTRALKICISSKRLQSEVRKKALLEIQ